MSEVKQFKTLLVAWLESISALTAIIGTRVYQGFPERVIGKPLLSYELPHEPNTDYPAPAWAAELLLTAYSAKADELDDIEDAIHNWLAANDIDASLSDSDVKCVAFRLVEVMADEPVLEPEQDRLMYLARTIRFAVTFAKVSDG
jgi:hypothetical protein